MSFAADTAVEALGDGAYDAHIRPGWDIAGNANGGYLMALAARAMAHASGRPDPVTITAHYLHPGHPGPARATVKTLKEGKRFSTMSTALSAGGRPVLQALAAFSDLSRAESGVQRIEASPPILPAPEDCARHSPAAGAPPMFGSVDLRLHPEDAGFVRGSPSGLLKVRGWFRLRDDEALDTLALLLAVDAFPPTVFNSRLPVAWTPTIELTAHIRARPVPGWLRATFATRFVSGGYLEEDGEIWDASDRLVAQSRQLALMPRAG